MKMSSKRGAEGVAPYLLLVGGNAVLYPVCVIGLFLLYILAFYGVDHLIKRAKNKNN